MDGSGRWHCGGAHFAANCTQAGQGQKGGIRPLCGLCNPTGTSHGKGNLQLDRINSGGSSEDSELQLEKISGGGSSKDRTNSEDPGEPLVPAGSVSKGPAGIGRQGLQTGLCQTGLCETGNSEKGKRKTQSFYPLRNKAVVMSATMDSNLLTARKKIINGGKFCNKARRLEDYKGRNSFGCLEDCAESDDEGIEDSDVEMVHFHFDKDRRDNTSRRGNVSFPSAKETALKRSYKQVVTGIGNDSEGFHRVASKKEKKEARKVSSLGIRMPEGLKSMEEAPEWEVLEMAMDSGASESVVNDEMLPRVETLEGEAMKKGVQYEVADGTLIPNLGEKKFIAVSDNGVARQMRAQVCDVNKALLSVHRVVQAGNRVVFASSGSYVEDETAGETMELIEKGGMYMLKLWVKAQGFSGLNEA